MAKHNPHFFKSVPNKKESSLSDGTLLWYASYASYASAAVILLLIFDALTGFTFTSRIPSLPSLTKR